MHIKASIDYSHVINECNLCTRHTQMNQGVECTCLHYWNEVVRYRSLLLYVYNLWSHTRLDSEISPFFEIAT